MKYLLAAMLTGGLVLLSASNAFALFSVSADVPVTYSFDDSAFSDESVSGLAVGVNLPFFVGLGLENYSVDGKAGGSDFTYDVAMYDLYLDIPFPFLNLSIGGGLGKGKFDSDDPTVDVEDADLTQVFAAVGYPFAGIFDVHVGYHQINGSAGVKIGGTPAPDANLDASMWTLGLRVGF